MPETEDYKADYEKTSNSFENFSSKEFQNINKNFPEKSDTRRDFYEWLVSLKGEDLTRKFENLHFIIDEAQDMPPGFYGVLQSLGCKNFFIVADQNQQITDDNSSIQELEDLLNIECDIKHDANCPHVDDKQIPCLTKCVKYCVDKDEDEDSGPRDYIDLKESYRQRSNIAIAVLAQHFFT